jgi:hypothetical protein
MSLSRPFRLGHAANAGADPEPVEDADAMEARTFRVCAARERSSWTEIAEPVRRGRWLVDAESDRLFSV